jgi:hypothetical protein
MTFRDSRVIACSSSFGCLSYVTTLKRLGELKGTKQDRIQIHDVLATSGSVAGAAMIEAPSCEDAMRFVCRETPILDLEWHVEEFVEPTRMAEILDGALKRR